MVEPNLVRLHHCPERRRANRTGRQQREQAYGLLDRECHVKTHPNRRRLALAQPMCQRGRLDQPLTRLGIIAGPGSTCFDALGRLSVGIVVIGPAQAADVSRVESRHTSGFGCGHRSLPRLDRGGSDLDGPGSLEHGLERLVVEHRLVADHHRWHEMLFYHRPELGQRKPDQRGCIAFVPQVHPVCSRRSVDRGLAHPQMASPVAARRRDDPLPGPRVPSGQQHPQLLGIHDLAGAESQRPQSATRPPRGGESARRVVVGHRLRVIALCVQRDAHEKADVQFRRLHQVQRQLRRDLRRVGPRSAEWRHGEPSHASPLSAACPRARISASVAR